MSLRENLNVFEKTQKNKQKSIEKEISKTDKDGNEDVVTIP